MPEEFYSKVAGALQKNDDGSDRQAIIKKCSIGETLHLLPEPTNTHSKHAIRVVRQNGQQLGYLPDSTARSVTRHLKGGGAAWAAIKDLTGGERGKESRGVNLVVYQDDSSAGMARQPATGKRGGGAKLVLLTGVVTAFLIWLMSR